MTEGGTAVAVCDPRSLAAVSEAVTAHTLDRIAALEPRLHAYAHVRSDAALADARAADARRARGTADPRPDRSRGAIASRRQSGCGGRMASRPL